MNREEAMIAALTTFGGQLAHLLKPVTTTTLVQEEVGRRLDELQQAVLRILRTPLTSEERMEQYREELRLLSQAAKELEDVLEKRGCGPYFQGRDRAVRLVAGGMEASEVVNFLEAECPHLLSKERGARESFAPPDYGETLGTIEDQLKTILGQLARWTKMEARMVGIEGRLQTLETTPHPTPPQPPPRNSGGTLGETAEGAEKLAALKREAAEPVKPESAEPAEGVPPAKAEETEAGEASQPTTTQGETPGCAVCGEPHNGACPKAVPPEPKKPPKGLTNAQKKRAKLAQRRGEGPEDRNNTP